MTRILNPKVKQALISILGHDDIKIYYERLRCRDEYNIYSQNKQPVFHCWCLIRDGDYKAVGIDVYNPTTAKMEQLCSYSDMRWWFLTEDQKSVIDLIEKVKKRYQIAAGLNREDKNVLSFLGQFTR